MNLQAAYDEHIQMMSAHVPLDQSLTFGRATQATDIARARRSAFDKSMFNCKINVNTLPT